MLFWTVEDAGPYNRDLQSTDKPKFCRAFFERTRATRRLRHVVSISVFQCFEPGGISVMNLTSIKTRKSSIIARMINSNRIFLICSIGLSALSTISNIILCLMDWSYEIFPTSSFSIMRMSLLSLVFESISFTMIVCAIPALILFSLSLLVLEKRKIPAVILLIYYVLDTFFLIFLWCYEIFVGAYFCAYYFFGSMWGIWILFLLYHYLKSIKSMK